MYRYYVDNAVTYTPEDLVLFRESPFASWMERLCLENPGHGIPPDVGSSAPQSTVQRQDDVADTLRTEGRDVALIDWDEDERERRASTLAAMRSGADFIVNGQLALGPLSGAANLLMRTSGFSQLGGYLYIPCDTQAQTIPDASFRLCFLADLLHSLQGQLPPQILTVRGSADVLPRETEDHIYYYRAVKQRLMASMRDFRKHRMPDPAESTHFGRWSDCASEVLKQRALREEEQVEDSAQDALEPHAAAVVATGAQLSPYYDLDDAGMSQSAVHEPVSSSWHSAIKAAEPRDAAADAAPATLAEQALMLAPDAFAGESQQRRPGSTPNLASLTDPVNESPEGVENALTPERVASDRRNRNRRDHSLPGHSRRRSDVALQNLQFIGSNDRSSLLCSDSESSPVETATAQAEDRSVPIAQEMMRADQIQVDTEVGDSLEVDPKPGIAQEFFSSSEQFAEDVPARPHPLDAAGFSIHSGSVVDLDTVDIASPPPVFVPAESSFDSDSLPNADTLTGSDSDSTQKVAAVDQRVVLTEVANKTGEVPRPFSDSLITNIHYRD